MASKQQLKALRDKWPGYLKNQPGLGELRKKLLSLGGQEVVPVIEEDLDDLLTHGEKFSRRRINHVPGEPGRCHSNVCRMWEQHQGGDDGDFRIVTGWALSADGLWRQHSWGLWDPKGFRSGVYDYLGERVVETTEKRTAYFGFLMSDEAAQEFSTQNL